MADSTGQISAYIKFVSTGGWDFQLCYPCIIQNGSIVWQGDGIKTGDSETVRLNDPKGPGAFFPKDGVTCNVGFKLDPTGHETTWTHDNPVTYAWNGNTAGWDIGGYDYPSYTGNFNG